MKVGIGADHGGYALKTDLVKILSSSGYEVKDFGASQWDPLDDYPDFILPLAKALADGLVDRGVAVCGSGVGASVAANKVHGVRAALINDHFSAHQGVEDDDMNLICLGGRTTGNRVAEELVLTFLEARFTGEERHLRRLEKVAQLEK